jgi:TRAP transporter TAXI family solute receptor
MRRLALMVAAALLGLLALGSLGFFWASQPVMLTVAVGNEGSEDFKLIQAMANALKKERSPVRLKVVASEGPAASSHAVDQGSTDLAVIRSDAGMPVKGRTLAILHRNAAVLITREGTQIKGPADLAGKKIGILRFNPANQAMLERILSQYDVLKEAITIIPLNFTAEAAKSIKDKSVDAIMIAGPPSGRIVPDTVTAITQAIGTPVFVAVSEADAITTKSAAFESIEILRGAFGGAPPRPEETFTTLGFSHRLVAQSSLDDDTAATLTRLIFEMRPALARESILGALIEEPSTEKDASLPVHPGAAAYFNDEVPTFMDRYGDWFYIIVMLGSVFGSAIAGMASYASGQSRSRALSVMGRLQQLILSARKASSMEELDKLDREIDDILTLALSKAAKARLDSSMVGALNMGLSHARVVIAQSREVLRSKPARPLVQASGAIRSVL